MQRSPTNSILGHLNLPVTYGEYLTTMRHNNHRLVCHLLEIFQQFPLCWHIQRTGRLIQQQNRAVRIDSSGNCKPLHLPLRKPCAVFSKQRIHAVFQLVHKLIGTGDLQRSAKLLFLKCAAGCKCDDLPNGAAHQLISLRHIGKQPVPAGIHGMLCSVCVL